MTGTLSMMVGGKVAPALSAVVAPSTETWSFVYPYYQTGDLTVTPTGGTGPYTYYVERVSGSLNVFEGPQGGATFRVYCLDNNPAVIRVLVADANSVTAYTYNVSIS